MEKAEIPVLKRKGLHGTMTIPWEVKDFDQSYLKTYLWQEGEGSQR